MLLSLTPSPIPNFLTNEVFTITPADSRFDASALHISQIVEICNQSAVYQVLFAKRLQGKAYSSEDAERFLRWAQRGWQEQTHFVFLIISPQANIAGAIDIKSNDLESAEIGYWLSDQYSGVMTNAVKALVEIAQLAGCKELFARVRTNNFKSEGVMRRSGFAITSSLITDEIPYNRFTIRP